MHMIVSAQPVQVCAEGHNPAEDACLHDALKQAGVRRVPHEPQNDAEGETHDAGQNCGEGNNKAVAPSARSEADRHEAEGNQEIAEQRDGVVAAAFPRVAIMINLRTRECNMQKCPVCNDNWLMRDRGS